MSERIESLLVRLIAAVEQNTQQQAAMAQVIAELAESNEAIVDVLVEGQGDELPGAQGQYLSGAPRG